MSLCLQRLHWPPDHHGQLGRPDHVRTAACKGCDDGSLASVPSSSPPPPCFLLPTAHPRTFSLPVHSLPFPPLPHCRSRNIDQEWFWYESSEGTKQDGQASGAYIFRPNSSYANPVTTGPATVSVATSDEVTIVTQSWAPWLSAEWRLYKGQFYVETEFSVGPVPIGTSRGMSWEGVASCGWGGVLSCARELWARVLRGPCCPPRACSRAVFLVLMWCQPPPSSVCLSVCLCPRNTMRCAADDDLGKEVFTRFTSDIASNNVSYTDSNGREMQRRQVNFRPTWNLTVEEPVAGVRLGTWGGCVVL